MSGTATGIQRGGHARSRRQLQARRCWRAAREARAVSRLATRYLPRRPQETVLYGLVKEHWRDFVQHAREAYEAPLPKYVVDEFQKYLTCGDFAAGFTVTD